jgi:hypothetical protein
MEERSPIRQWVLAAAGVAMLVGAVAIVRHERAPAPTTQAAPSSRTPLYIDREGATMRLHWNPASPDVRAANRGAVVIHDGKRESRLELTPAELRSGVASYWPESKEVSFRLELDGGQAGEVRASAQVDEKPSPFVVKEPPRRKAHPIKRVPVETAQAQEVKKESGFSRTLGKIPLLRRLRGKDKHHRPQMEADRRR